ncbi:protein mono-ADP-ribosyltransferase PARP12-like [Chanos chanos]|uniref:Protein mono-ADP-ribosyltransferase PARP12-like n=1 Tax=Chanos chanos TaxID=29144 RepID=A0A6J2UTD0_CHACN|nr:protein mono-ADP-ribosyltransferase PARP12-like [Chanos chanos]
MAEESLIHILCGHGGAMDYDSLIDISSGMPDLSGLLETVIQNKELFTVVQNGESKRVIAKTNLRICSLSQCVGCNDLHLCKLYLLGKCGRRKCSYSHDFNSDHNTRTLREKQLQSLSKTEIRQLLLQNDRTLLPRVCVSYNKGSGEYGNCPDREECKRLHICEKYIRGKCHASNECSRSHDFYEPHPKKTLHQRHVPNELMESMLSIYQNILALEDSNQTRYHPGPKPKENTKDKKANEASQRENLQNAASDEICLSFVKGFCKFEDKCWRVHFKMPYRWQVQTGDTWVDLPDNEGIERDFCDPSKIHSTGNEPVCFDTMTQGLDKVRRLSTVSSVIQPTFILTTDWAWYWEDEYDKWIKYKSIKEMHRMASINSAELEKEYHKDRDAVVHFTAGQQSYELSFTDMTQRNERTGMKRAVRRRPIYMSSKDVQMTRSSKKGAYSTSRNTRKVPPSWDKTLIPETGYQRVHLHCSDRDYQWVQERFSKTMRGFNIVSIERVQNMDLLEDFQTKKERMKKANKDKKYGEGEQLLFHGTDHRHIDAICRENFDWRVCGANGTVYGEGSYFARDASYSHGYISKQHSEKVMFACRVLVGSYTRGQSHYRRPPSKEDNTFYDSCVNDVRDPSIYVVFEKQQVYPEFLITYREYEPPQAPAAVSSSSRLIMDITIQSFSDTNPANTTLPAPSATVPHPGQSTVPSNITSMASSPTPSPSDRSSPSLPSMSHSVNDLPAINSNSRSPPSKHGPSLQYESTAQMIPVQVADLNVSGSSLTPLEKSSTRKTITSSSSSLSFTNSTCQSYATPGISTSPLSFQSRSHLTSDSSSESLRRSPNLYQTSLKSHFHKPIRRSSENLYRVPPVIPRQNKSSEKNECVLL